MGKYPALFILVVFILSPLFFFRLSSSSLVSFDEAWYASISENIRTKRDIFNLSFNGTRYADHPPAGFWLISLSQWILGNNEFGTRFISALLGLITLGLIYILGSKTASPSVGIASALTLASSPWFIFRARSGNLDIILTFFFVLSFVLAIYASRHKKFLVPLGLSLSLLFLSKTAVPFTIIPSLFVIFWQSGYSLRTYIPALLSFLAPFGAWIISQLIHYPGFYNKYFKIGFPTARETTTLKDNLLLTKTYIHEGIGATFRPAVIALPFGLLIRNKLLLSYLIFIAVFLFPFLFSSKGQIWHLIPIHPFLILIFFSIIYLLFKKILPQNLTSAIIITLSFLIAIPQISRNWQEFINIPGYISDEAILSHRAGKFPYPLYIDDRFAPVAAYYSKKVVIDVPTSDILDYFKKSTPILLITHDWRLKVPGIQAPRYQILASDRDMLLILISTSSARISPL